MKIPIRKLTYTAVFFVIIIIVQQFKFLNQYFSEPLVNAALIVGILYLGWLPGIFLAVMSPVSAVIIFPSPVLGALPQMAPMIIIANILLIVFTKLFRRKDLTLGLALGSLVKCVFLWVSVYHVIGVSGGGLSPETVESLELAYSLNQMMTALMGSAMAYPIWQHLKITKVRIDSSFKYGDEINNNAER
jgi:hypothetical protein